VSHRFVRHTGGTMTAMPELGMTVLPGSVVASHFQASATGLADGTTPQRAAACVGTTGELAAIIGHLVAGQHYVSATLAQLADYLRGRRLTGALDEVPAEDLIALTEVLRAAAQAAGFSAEALAESRPMVQVVLDVTGADTHL
jgi:hypothetical protein